MRPSHTPVAFLAELTAGTNVVLNDQPAIAHGWAPLPIHVFPGRHHLQVSTRWRGEFGRAAISIDVRPGETVTVYYRSPALSVSAGAIGFAPQRTPAIGVIWGIAAALVLLLALGVTLVLI